MNVYTIGQSQMNNSDVHHCERMRCLPHYGLLFESSSDKSTVIACQCTLFYLNPTVALVGFIKHSITTLSHLIRVRERRVNDPDLLE